MSIQTHQLDHARAVANWLIYASIIVGIGLLFQLYMIVPTWLFYSVLTGWIAYLVDGIAATLRVKAAYPTAIALAFLTLAVSVPQPEHYSFGLSIPSLTFFLGSALQVGVIVSVLRFLLLQRKK